MHGGAVRPKPKSPRERWADWQELLAEPALSDYWAQLPRDRRTQIVDVLRRPSRHLAAGCAIARLPHREAWLSDRPEGMTLTHQLTDRAVLGTRKGLTGVCVLDIPADAEQYQLGSSKQTLRRKARAARELGVTWRPVDDPVERRALLARAVEWERQHPDEQHRNEHPDLEDMLDISLWLAAFDGEGVPILLSVTPVDGEWALLRYFRSLGSRPACSDSRYLMTQALVEALSARGVRHLVDSVHPNGLANGLRQFQRMVGFRLVRVTPRRLPAISIPQQRARS